MPREIFIISDNHLQIWRRTLLHALVFGLTWYKQEDFDMIYSVIQAIDYVLSNPQQYSINAVAPTE
ncbi:hypothetical protein EBS40_06495 [bacterium]|nr:hypothetical protein [bacterium]